MDFVDTQDHKQHITWKEEQYVSQMATDNIITTVLQNAQVNNLRYWAQNGIRLCIIYRIMS